LVRRDERLDGDAVLLRDLLERLPFRHDVRRRDVGTLGTTRKGRDADRRREREQDRRDSGAKTPRHRTPGLTAEPVTRQCRREKRPRPSDAEGVRVWTFLAVVSTQCHADSNDRTKRRRGRPRVLATLRAEGAAGRWRMGRTSLASTSD